MIESVHVSAPSRLHFGLLSFGHPEQTQYGGVGVMLEQPRWKLTIRPAEMLKVCGPGAQRARMWALRWSERVLGQREIACEIDIREGVAGHVGLGSGTQLALAIAGGLFAARRLPAPTPEVLAHSVGRGNRSAVGTHGFRLGGLIAELGHGPHEILAPLHQRVPLPNTWRWVLVRLGKEAGMHGSAEVDAFRRLTPVPSEKTAWLRQEMVNRMLPAAVAGDLERFGESVFAYGRTAGDCFAACQGGPFASPQVAALVDFLRHEGVAGAGQSSWGPTVFALTGTADVAERLAEKIRARYASQGVLVTISGVDNLGAEIRTPRECGV